MIPKDRGTGATVSHRTVAPVAGALIAVGSALLALGVLACSPSGHRAERHVVEISGMAFHPATLEVRPGDTVVWINRDIFPHTATATTATLLDTHTLAPGDSSRVVIGAAGELPYHCTLHPVMTGTLIVR